MIFQQFCETVKASYFGYNQVTYLECLFKAAGLMRNYSESYLASVSNGTKPFSSNMKKQFKKPVNSEPIAAFYEKELEDEYVDVLVDAFDIPTSIERNKKYIAGALAKQIKVFIESNEEDVPVVIPEEYENQRIKKETAHYEIGKSLYEGDSVWVENSGKINTVGFYNVFTYTWVIHNYGNVYWRNRKLVFVNADDKDMAPKAAVIEIPIPDTAPYGIVKISTDFDARGDENKYECRWEMQNSEGKNCFPNSRYIFDVIIDVIPEFDM